MIKSFQREQSNTSVAIHVLKCILSTYRIYCTQYLVIVTYLTSHSFIISYISTCIFFSYLVTLHYRYGVDSLKSQVSDIRSLCPSVWINHWFTAEHLVPRYPPIPSTPASCPASLTTKELRIEGISRPPNGEENRHESSDGYGFLASLLFSCTEDLRSFVPETVAFHRSGGEGAILDATICHPITSIFFL